MHAELRAQLAFRLTGLRDADGDDSRSKRLRPALAARLFDLAPLRYDFPVVLLDAPVGDEVALTLTQVIDRVLDEVTAAHGDNDQLPKDVLDLERWMRALVANGSGHWLSQLWDAARTHAIAQGRHETFAANLASARAALRVDGGVVDCTRDFPARFVRHAWKAVQARKAERFHAEVSRLVTGLLEILDAATARSPAGRTPPRLRESMGGGYRDAFDFDAMARILAGANATSSLPESRRQRISGVIASLESHRFFMGVAGNKFEFDGCAAALKAFRSRLPALVELSRSMAIARLEVEGRYVESRHDALFARFGAAALEPEDLAQFPDYLVLLDDARLDAAEEGDLAVLLRTGVPVKVLVQTHDLLGDAPDFVAVPPIGARSQSLAGLAIGLGDVFVLQSSASNLPRLRDRLMSAVSYAGPALFTVYSGASGETSLAPYLEAAAAMESRAFPAFTYDPGKDGIDTPRLSLENNPQPERDWPVHAFEYEDAEHQRRATELDFTLADFLAADARLARLFLQVPAHEGIAPVAGCLDEDPARIDVERSPGVRMIDGSGTLRDLVVAQPILRQARRCRDQWRRLRQLASGAPRPVIPTQEVADPVAAPVAAPPPDAPPIAPAAVAPAAAPSADEPYIETPRCTTCEECMQVNKRMFGYDANKQAFIADPDAGTYRELVEAAENCQVSIIHPGKPRNPDEPGLAELIERAAPFR